MSTTFFDEPVPEIDWTPFIQSLDWSPVRRPRRIEDWLLMAETTQWLNTLPVGVRPLQLPKKFARIANKICKLWNAPYAMQNYFDSLLHDKRGDRQGFPALIREELQALHAYSFCAIEGFGACEVEPLCEMA